MAIALDSPRWQNLSHAYGKAGDTPDLIRAIRKELTPDYSDGGAWFEVYSSLFHQSSTYSATYAAIPHLVGIAVEGNLWQRVAVMCLLGEINIAQSWVEARIAPDLLADFEPALNEVKRFALGTIREAGPLIHADHSTWWTVGELFQGFGGLYFPKSGYVVQLGHMVREEWQVECDCPTCGERMAAELCDKVVRTLKIDDGAVVEESARQSAIDRSAYPDVIRKKEAVTGAWTEAVFPIVMSSLADEVGDSLLATRILDLGTVVRCPYCDASFKLSNALTAM